MKDVLGNELHENDLVALQLERPLVCGVVRKIEEGGLVTGVNHKGEAQIRMGMIQIEALHTIQVDPRFPIGAVLAVRSPESEAQPSSKEQDATGYRLRN